MKKITEITTEREFISKLRTYYRKGRRKGYQRNEISFLGVMEYTGRATREFEYQSDKYFSVGIRAYDWAHGNSLLSALIDKWENEIEAEKRKKQRTQATETPQISTEAAETVNVSAEGEKAAGTKEMPRYECPNYADYAFERGWSIENIDFDAHSGVLCMIHFDPTDEKYVCGCLWQINSDSPNYTEHRRFKTLKGAQNYGTKRMGMELKHQTLTAHCPIAPTEPSQSSETPQSIKRTTDTPKPRETARKRQNRGIGCARMTRHSGLGAGGYEMLDNASATLAAMNAPYECSTADYW